MGLVRVEIISRSFRGSELVERVTGIVSLDRAGEVHFDEGAERLRRLTVVEPGNPKHRLFPEDGAAYLRALPANYRGSYVGAVLVDD